jgi:5-methylcytosine-specific restriction endonuclease McrA
MKLGIVMNTKLCYTGGVESYGARGVLLLNAVTNHNLLLWAKRPLSGGLTSRRTIRHRRQLGRGCFVMKKCNKCEEWKDLSDFTKSKVTKDGLRHYCRECESIRWKLWYQANKEKRSQYNREYLPANRDKRQAYNKTYRAKNPGKSTETSRTWRENNPEKSKAKWHKRQAQKLGNGGSYTGAEWKALCDHYGNKCLACRESKPLTVDHVVPVSKGGSNDISNIQPLCRSCNTSKLDKTIDYRY